MMYESMLNSNSLYFITTILKYGLVWVSSGSAFTNLPFTICHLVVFSGRLQLLFILKQNVFGTEIVDPHQAVLSRNLYLVITVEVQNQHREPRYLFLRNGALIILIEVREF